MTRNRSSEPELSVSSSAGAAPARRKTAAATRTRKKPVAAVEGESASEIVLTPVAETVVVAAYVPAYEEVAVLAYSLWEARGCQGGSAEEDWLTAEQQLRARQA